MEEVWNDISLASLHEQPTRAVPATTATHPTFRTLIFQDYFARPLNRDPSPSPVPTEPTAPVAAGFLGSPAPPPPATLLSLNLGPELQYLERVSDPTGREPQLCNHANVTAPSFISSLDFPPFDALASPSVFSSFCKKRPPENENSSGDRRHKRMIKNRESAARSRARKQAYTYELELEVAHLMEENARLKRQQEKLCFAAPAQVPKKRTLYRTSTAPF